MQITSPRKTLSGVAMVCVMSLSLATTTLVAPSFASAVSPATPVARALLNMAIVPPRSALVHPATNVVCQCAGTPADPRYLVTMHRIYAVPGTPASVEEFLATHVPRGGVEGGEGSSGAILTNTTDFPANGPHIYFRQLAYATTSRNASSSWLRIDSQIVWVPSRSSSQLVTGAVSGTMTGYTTVGLSGSSGATTVRVAGNKLTSLLRVLNSLPLGPPSRCMEALTGFVLTISLKSGADLHVYNDFCGGPLELVSTQTGNLNETRYSLSDTSCSLIKEVVSLFGHAPVRGTRVAVHSCEVWTAHPVA